MQQAALGSVTAPVMGLGCMGMSGSYGRSDWDTSIATIRRAIDLGVTLLDTADIYGFGHNEALVGRAVHDRRDKVQVATKFGLDFSDGDLRIRGTHGYVLSSCDASLQRLGTDQVDLYYLHGSPAPGARRASGYGRAVAPCSSIIGMRHGWMPCPGSRASRARADSG